MTNLSIKFKQIYSKNHLKINLNLLNPLGEIFIVIKNKKSLNTLYLGTCSGAEGGT